MVTQLRRLLCGLVGHNWRIRMSGQLCHTCKAFKPFFEDES